MVSLRGLQGFLQRHYRPELAALAVVGDVNADEVFAAVERYFGPIPNPQVPVPSRSGSLPTESTTTWVADVFARTGHPPDLNAEARQLALVDAKQVQLWAQGALHSKTAQAVIFAHAQAILPLTLLGDAAQVRLHPF